MTATKRASTKKPAGRDASPPGRRPYIPGYGIPKDKKEMLAWSHVSERMAKAQHYWICTVSPDGRPHATPVDGLWLEGQLFFGGSPTTRRNRNLAANPSVCVHLESGADVVILHGDARTSRVDRALAVRLAEESARKYAYAPKPEEYEKGEGVFAFRPRVVFAWKQFPRDATRWRFPDGG